MTSSTESSKSRPGSRKSLSRSSSSGRESSRLSSHRLATKLSGRYRTRCATSPAGGQMRGEHNVAGYGQCRSRRREGSMPIESVSELARMLGLCFPLGSYPHSRVQRSSNVIVLLKPRAATENLGKPELSNSSLHVTDLSLCRLRSLDPLRRLAANTTDHVRMCESLWCSLLWLEVEVECGRDGLCDSGVQRRGSARNDQVVVALVSSAWPGIAVARPRTTREGGVGCQGRRHFLSVECSRFALNFPKSRSWFKSNCTAN